MVYSLHCFITDSVSEGDLDYSTSTSKKHSHSIHYY